MLIQEKIQKKAEEYRHFAPVFLDGAKFALENQWISVDDDLPYNHQELIYALNKVEDKSKEVLHYDYESIEGIEENDYVVLH